MTTIDKALDILFFLHDRANPIGVSEIGRALDLPKSSTHRLCMTLLRRGLLERDGQGRFCPGMALIHLASGVSDIGPLISVARPILRRFADQIGETFFLVGERSGILYVLDKAEGTGPLQVSPKVGSQLPVHATAVGKLYLAFAPVCVTTAQGDFKRYTTKTIIATEQLHEQVEKVKKMGYAVNHEEWMEGLSVVAAPILVDPAKKGEFVMRGAVATALMTNRMDAAGVHPIAEQVVEAATEVRKALERKGDGFQ